MSDPEASRSYRLGKAVTVTLPEAVAAEVTARLSEAFGRSTRERRAQGRRTTAERLSTDRIIDEAIDQMRQHGYDAVTMRSIAKALDTGPASLYAHVANRADLDELVVGRVCSQWRVPDPDPEHWDDQIRAAMLDLLALYRAHPGVARCTMAMIPSTSESLVPTERVLAILRSGGVADQHAAWFIDTLSLFVSAIAMEEDLWRERGQTAGGGSDQEMTQKVVARVRDAYAGLPAEHFPTIRSMASALTTGSADERVDFGIRLLVGGLSALGGAPA